MPAAHAHACLDPHAGRRFFRVARVVDVLATSHAAQLAAAAAAKLLAAMLLPWNPALAVQLCPQQLRCQLLPKHQHQQQGSGSGAVQFRVQAALKEPEALLVELLLQQDGGAGVCCLRWGMPNALADSPYQCSKHFAGVSSGAGSTCGCSLKLLQPFKDAWRH